MQRPQLVHAGGERLQLGDLLCGERLAERLAPCLDALEVGGLIPHCGLVAIIGHPGVGHEEVVDSPGRSRRHPLRGEVEPALAATDRLPKLPAVVHLTPRPHQRVAANELEAEPRHVAVLVDAVQPQRYFRQLDRNRIQVHTEDVAVGDEVLHLLQLVGVVGVRDTLPKLTLAPVQVLLRELVDGFVEEGRRTHRRLTDGEVQDSARRHVVGNQLLEGVLHDAPSQTLRGVVAGGLLAVPPGQPVDEPALGMDLELPQAVGARLEHAFFLAVLVQLAQWHEPGVLELVRVLAGWLHFVQILLREEATVREQRLVDGAELIDAELGVGDAPATARPALRRTGEGHQADDLLQDLVAELHAVQKRGCVLPEQGAIQGADLKGVVERAGQDVRVTAVEAVPDQPEQGLYALVNVVAVQGLAAVRRTSSKSRRCSRL